MNFTLCFSLSIFAMAMMTHCQIVTVPVKAAGSIVTATVETTGDVVTAPFDAVSGRSARSNRDRGEDSEED